MPQKRSGDTAGLEESGSSAGGAECSVTARRARCHASSQRPDRPRARDRATTARAAPHAAPRAPPPRPSRRAGPPRAALSAARAPSAGAPRRRRSPRAILARRSVSRGLGEEATEPGCFLAYPARAQRPTDPCSSAAPASPSLPLRFRILQKVPPRPSTSGSVPKPGNAVGGPPGTRSHYLAY